MLKSPSVLLVEADKNLTRTGVCGASARGPERGRDPGGVASRDGRGGLATLGCRIRKGAPPPTPFSTVTYVNTGSTFA